MEFHQAVTNTVGKRGSSAEFSRWRDSGVDPELLQSTVPVLEIPATEARLTPKVEAFDNELSRLVAQAAARHAGVQFEEV